MSDLETDLEPDDDTMFRFLSWWFRRCTRGVIELGWTDERTGKLSLFRRFPLDAIEQAVRFATETNARPGCSVYFRPATVKADTQYTHDGDVVQIPGIWGDSDTLQSCQRILAADEIIPSAQIITGRHPALRSQFYWLFSSEPILIVDWSRELNRRVQLLSDSDPAVTNPSTLMRLPGSIAWAWKPGRQPELTEWITPDGGGNSITIDQLKARLPELATASASVSRANGAAAADELLNPCYALIEQARIGPLWHDPTLRAVAMMVSRGFPDWSILTMAEHITWPSYSVQQTRDELLKMIEGARRKGFDPGVADSVVDDVMDVAPKPSTSFPMLSDTDLIAMPDPEWLVTDFLVADTLCVLYGQFSTFKSFLALDFALCLATGTPWCGRPVQQCDVLYIAGEGIGGLKRRVSAWKQHHGITTPITGFRVIPLAVNLMDRNEAERLIASVTAADDFKPKFIIVDTLARAMPGGDENSAKDIGVPVRHGGIIQSRLGCALMLVHHAGKDAERGLRGSSGLPGAADTVLRLTRDGHSVTLQVEKQKDHDAEQTLRLRSQVIDLPLLPGSLKSRTSLVLVQDEADAPVRSDRNLTKTERTAKRYLADLIVAEGKPLPPGSGFPSPVKGQNLLGVPIDRWREECETRRLSAADTKNSRGFAFRRTFQGLLDKNAIAARDELVWTA